MMPGIKTIWVLTGMTLQIVDKPLTLAMKIMVLTRFAQFTLACSSLSIFMVGIGRVSSNQFVARLLTLKDLTPFGLFMHL
jgi:hypothetical protein